MLLHHLRPSKARSKSVQFTRMLLARHAETAAPDRFHGAESDIGLSEFGARQAGRLAEYLSTQGAAAVYSSAMRRAVDTAKLIAEACKVEPIPIAALHERRIGPLSGLSREEGWAMYAASKTRWVDGDLDHTHEGGESYNDIRRRIVPVLEELSARHAGETIIVIAHGVVIRVALTSLLVGARPSNFDRFAIDFASVNDLRFDGRSWTAHALNLVIAASGERPVA
jgi:2,3-bisphosphoglycerate-dependent phosphoglycerate mutase